MRLLGAIVRTVVGCSIFLFLATTCIPGAQTNQENLQPSCRDFVRKFYDWYVPIALRDNRGPAFDVALKNRPSVFSPELFRQLSEDSEAQAKATGEIVGIDFDPFLNSQDPSEHFVVGDIRPNNDSYLADVYGMDSGKKREKVVAELVRKNNRWLFVNFHYPDDKPGSGKSWDLLSMLKKLREDRQKYAK